MSVVPLVPGKTVVFTPEEFEAQGGAGGGAILIQHHDPTQLSPTDIPVSYDLRVGPEYRDHRSIDGRRLAEGDEIVLLPGMAVIVKTEEEVRFPRSAFGAIVPKVSLLEKGISNTTSKVDPGYVGPLVVTAFNLGRKTVRLKRKDAFCALYVVRVLDGASLYNGAGKVIGSIRSKRAWDNVLYLIEARQGLLSVLLLAASLVLVALNVVQLLAKHR